MGFNKISGGSAVNPLITIVILLALLLAYFIIVVIQSRNLIRAHRALHRKSDTDKKTVIDFLNGVFNNRDAGLALKYLSSDYIEHDPAIQTGRQAFIDAAVKAQEKYPKRKLEIKRVIADHDCIVVHSRIVDNPSDSNSKETAVVDIFRLENNLITSHWSVAQSVPKDPANQNTMF